MIESKKVTCEFSSFIDKLNPEKSYSNYNMVSIGNTNETSLGYHSFKTLLSFNMDDIDKDSIINAYLSIFIRKIERSDYEPSSIGLYIGKDFNEYESISWNSLESDDPANILNISIPYHITNSFVKINITKLMKNSSTNTGKLNIVLYPSNHSEKYAVILSSALSKNPPAIEFQIKESDIKTAIDFKDDDDKENEENTKYNDLLLKVNNSENMIKDIQTSMNIVISKLIENNEKSSAIANTISELLQSFSRAEDSLNKLNNNMLMIINQKQPVNIDNDNTKSDFSEEKITEINNKFDEAKASLDKLIKLLSSLSIENIN